MGQWTERVQHLFVGTGRRRVVGGVLVAFGLQFSILALWQAWTDSPTWDETIYVTAGHTGLTQRDSRINFDHPPLPKILAAVPAVLFADVEVPLDSGAWESADAHQLALETHAANRGDIQQIVFLYRLVPILQGLLIGLLLYGLTRDLVRWTAGLAAAVLWWTLPTTLAFCHLDCLDVPATLATVLVAWLVNRYADRPTLVRLALTGLGVGVGLLSRAGVGLVIALSAAFIVVLLGARRSWWRSLCSAAGLLFAAWMVVWIGYVLMDPNGLRAGTLPLDQRALLEPGLSGMNDVLIRWLPWPARFEVSLRYLVGFHAEVGPGYLFGVTFEEIPWWFWPGSMWLKTPPTAIVAGMAGFVMWLRLPPDRRTRGLLVLGIPMLGLIAMMSLAQRSYGVRYLLPLIALLSILSGPAVELVRTRKVGVVVIALFVLHLAMFWEAHPHSLTWSSPGFRPAWRYSADCNSDWGQGFAALQEWAKDKEEPYIAYFGFGPSWTLDEIPGAISAFPEGPMGPYRPPEEGTEWFAISASNLTIYQPGYFTLLRKSCPVDVLHESILIYRLTGHSGRLDDGQPEGLPGLPCPDADYSARLR